MEDRLRVNKLALKVPAWVTLAVARLNEVPGHLRRPPSFSECAAVLAFGDEGAAELLEVLKSNASLTTLK